MVDLIIDHLRLVKELCEGKEHCKIIPSQILAQHAKCHKVGGKNENMSGFGFTKKCSVDL